MVYNSSISRFIDRIGRDGFAAVSSWPAGFSCLYEGIVGRRPAGMNGVVCNKHADLFPAQSGVQRPVDMARQLARTVQGRQNLHGVNLRSRLAGHRHLRASPKSTPALGSAGQGPNSCIALRGVVILHCLSLDPRSLRILLVTPTRPLGFRRSAPPAIRLAGPGHRAGP